MILTTQLNCRWKSKMLLLGFTNGQILEFDHFWANEAKIFYGNLGDYYLSIGDEKSNVLDKLRLSLHSVG